MIHPRLSRIELAPRDKDPRLRSDSAEARSGARKKAPDSRAPAVFFEAVNDALRAEDVTLASSQVTVQSAEVAETAGMDRAPESLARERLELRMEMLRNSPAALDYQSIREMTQWLAASSAADFGRANLDGSSGISLLHLDI